LLDLSWQLGIKEKIVRHLPFCDAMSYKVEVRPVHQLQNQAAASVLYFLYKRGTRLLAYDRFACFPVRRQAALQATFQVAYQSNG